MWKNECKSKKCNAMTFDSREKIKLALESVLCTLNQDQEYNIYLHQINGYYDSFNNTFGEKAMKNKLLGIIKNGLELDRYATLFGTSNMVGSTKELNTDSILNYNYYMEKDCKIVCILALPKYVKVDNDLVEYSSFNSKGATDLDKELEKEYRKQIKSLPDLHHRKCTMFDAIKQFNGLPECYMLGALMIQESKNLYSFLEFNSHLSKLPKEEVTKHLKAVEKEIKNLYDKYQTKNIKEIIVKSYSEFGDYYSNIDDFDL